MAVALVPYIAFLEVSAVFAQKVPILLLKTARAMVLILLRKVLQHGIELTLAD